MFFQHAFYKNGFEEGHPCLIHMANRQMAHFLYLESCKKNPVIREADMTNVGDILKESRSTFGDTHQETFQAMYHIGWASLLCQETEKALFYFLKCKEGMERVWDAGHPELIQVLERIAECYAFSGDTLEEEKYREEIHKRKQQTERDRLEELVVRSTRQLQDMWEFRKELEEQKQKEEAKRREEERQELEKERSRQREAARLEYERKLQSNKKSSNEEDLQGEK